MRKKSTRRELILGLLVCLAGITGYAELELQQIMLSEGNKAVGLVIKDAAEAVFNSADDDESRQQRLIVILNEAVATGNESTVRYAIIAIMMAGGVDHLELSKLAVDNSEAFTVFPDMAAQTVTKMIWLLTGSGEVESGGDEQAGGGEEEFGGESLGGGRPVEFDQNEDSDPFESDIVDRDVPATPQ